MELCFHNWMETNEQMLKNLFKRHCHTCLKHQHLVLSFKYRLNTFHGAGPLILAFNYIKVLFKRLSQKMNNVSR